jgi:hypothetical protein
MSYELRKDGRVAGRFETSKEAEAHAREMLRENADSVIEVIDLTTGRPYGPAASAEDREAMARKIGF